MAQKYEANDSYKLLQTNRRYSLLQLTEVVAKYTNDGDNKVDMEKARKKYFEEKRVTYTK